MKKNMVSSEDYRLYLEEKFEGLAKHMNAQFENMNDTLDRVETQTIKTNNRVTHLEEKVEKLEIAEIRHVVDCPALPLVEDIKREVHQVEKEIIGSWLRKHWKLAIVVTFVILYFAVSLFELISISDILKAIKISV